MNDHHCVCRIRKPSLPTGTVYSIPELARLPVGFLTGGGEDPETEDVRPYCTEVRVCIREIDLEQIVKDYHLTRKAHIRTCSGAGDVGICDPDRSARTLHISAPEVQAKYLHSHVEHFFVYQREPVLTWKKNDVPACFRERLDKAGDGALQRLRREEIHAYNEAAGLRGWTPLPEETTAGDGALFFERCH